MQFINRSNESKRLNALGKPSFAVIWGRRRVGKTRLLIEWCERVKGLYLVGDMSAEAVQRSYFAKAIAERSAGFADVVYPDWRSFFNALAREAKRGNAPTTIVFDELPYLLIASPTLASVLQNWIDHQAKDAGLCVIVAGSSQHMMQDLVQSRTSPLYGRASEAFALEPIEAGYIREALQLADPLDAIQAAAVWGGIPRYWELAAPFGNAVADAVDSLVLDRLGPLHEEPERLLVEEQPSAAALRPILDLVGNGVHRVSEIAARLGQPATSLSRPLARLTELGLVLREQPFDSAERGGKRTLYRIGDPFFRLWFTLVAPNKAHLAIATGKQRRALLQRHLPHIVAQTWEALGRRAVPRLQIYGETFTAASRYWAPGEAEWDIVAESLDRKTLLLGEVKWQSKTADADAAYKVLLAKGVPKTSRRYQHVVHAVFVPKQNERARKSSYAVIDADAVLEALR